MARDTWERRGGRNLRFDELTSDSFAEAMRADPLVIIPIGATEEHGSHLPLGTDSFQCEEVARRLADEFDAIVLPPIRYGECRSTRNFPGTISLRSETVRALVEDVMSELVRNGVSKMLVLTGHAGSGHMAAIKLGALRVVEQHEGIDVMVLSDYDIAYDLAGKEFPYDDGHAGQIETSRMLAIRPELVGDDRPHGTTRPPRFKVVSDPQRYFPSGVMGDSRGASDDKGRRIDDYILKELSRIVAEGFGLRGTSGEDEG